MIVAMSSLYLFDVDGTLLNSGRAGQAAMEEALQIEFGITETDCDIPYAGRTDRAIIDDLLKWHKIEDTPENFQAFQSRYFELLPKHLGSRGGRVLPGVTEVLEIITKETNDWTGLLTGNFERSGWMKVQHFNIDHHFSFGAFGDVHPNRDDVARLASQTATDRHGHAIKTIWVIGDTPADVQCGRAIGAKVLAVATGHYSLEELEASEPDVTLTDMSDAARVAELLLG